MNNVIQVQNLGVTLGKREIIRDLSFDVQKNEVFVILGPNGAGKTTLLKALLGLIPYTGSVSWQTNSRAYLPPQELFARKNLPPLTIHDFFMLKSVTIKQVHAILDLVGLDRTVLSQQFETLSTGQFQRMCIAWSLVTEPEVLLFDEPTSGIDIGGEQTIYTLLHNFWQEKKLTIILVTHDLNVVWDHASRVLCLNKQALCIGTPEQVVTPEHLKDLYGMNVKFYRHRHNNNDTMGEGK